MPTTSPIVLVHGAFQSAGTWDLVAPRLEKHGRRVVVAPLTGLEPDTGPVSADVTLETHIRDVVALLEGDDLENAVLVGHSYAGMIITGVAEHVPSRLAQLVYVDALVPDHGQSAMDLFPETTRNTFRTLAEEGGGWRLRPVERLLDLWGLETGAARAFVKARMTDFTMQCFAEPLNAPTCAAATLPRTYIACVKEGYPGRAIFAPFADRASREGWPCKQMPTGHDCQAEMPDALCALLLECADSLPCYTVQQC